MALKQNNKLVEYTFEEDNIQIVDGEIIICDPKEYSARFMATTKALDLFEQDYGKPMIKTLLDMIASAGISNIEDIKSGIDNGMVGAMFETRFVKALASSCYFKIANGAFIQNEATAIEFRESPMYNLASNDVDFIVELIQSATNCIFEKQKKKQQQGKTKN